MIPEPNEPKLIIITYKPARSVSEHVKLFHTMTQCLDMPQEDFLVELDDKGLKS